MGVRYLSDSMPADLLVNSTQEETSSNWLLFFTISALIVCGSFTYSIYPPPVNAAALGLMVGLFYYRLHRQEPVLFFIQLFIGNFFIFGDKYGGNYNIAAFASIVFYLAINGKITFLRPSVLSGSVKTAMFVWAVFHFLSVMGGNHFPLVTELISVFAFFMMLYLFFLTSRIPFTEDDVYKWVIAICIFFAYEFLVALNQKYELLNSPFPFFPKTDETIVYDMGIVRSVSTLNDFEAFAEFSLSLIALLIPGILSGSFLKKSKFFYYFSMITVLLGVASIVYSGTRSSIALLPFVILSTCIMLGKRLKAGLIVLIITVVSGVFLLNSAYEFLDFSVFVERSEGMDFEHMTLEKILSGEEMNRGGVFAYAMKQVKKSNGIIGRGYFVSGEEYRSTQFSKDVMDDGVADYHNLYMSSYVLWGGIGVLCMLFLFFAAIFNGLQLYWRLRRDDHFMTDLLLGFTILFGFMLVNQFKIQFIRNINYFTIVMLMLSFYMSLTWLIKQTLLVKEEEPNNLPFA